MSKKAKVIFSIVGLLGLLVIFYTQIFTESNTVPDEILAGTNTIFVATDGIDLAECGDQDFACATIEYAAKQVVPALGGNIVVKPGVYFGQVKLVDLVDNFGKEFVNGLIITSEIPYAAKLTNQGKVLFIHDSSNITLSGFEIVADPTGNWDNSCTDDPNSDRLLIQISDELGGIHGPSEYYYDDNRRFIPTSDDYTHNITLRNNIIHDSLCDDIIKVQSAGSVTIEDNMIYNSSADGESLFDINGAFDVTVSNNIMFNDFAGSGRSIPGTHDFVVIKDSNVDAQGNRASNDPQGLPKLDGSLYPHPGSPALCNPAASNCNTITGSNNIRFDGNIMLNWQTDTNQNNGNSGWIAIGNEDTEVYLALNILFENNLFLGNSPIVTRAVFEIKDAYNVMIRNNTFSGDLPSRHYALRSRVNSSNGSTIFPSEQIYFYNNIISDHTGTMGAELGSSGGQNQFSDSPIAFVHDYEIARNLYWNGGNAIPVSSFNSALDFNKDATALVGDPQLRTPINMQMPRWNGTTFADGSTTISQVFSNLVQLYAIPDSASLAVDNADPDHISPVDILGKTRNSSTPEIGAYEFAESTPTPSPTLVATTIPSATPTATLTPSATPTIEPSTTVTPTVATPSLTPTVPPSSAPTATLHPTVQPTTSANSCGPIDVDGNGILDLVDFVGFAQRYGKSCFYVATTSACGNQDVNMDGKINIIDFASFAPRYRKTSCAL